MIYVLAWYLSITAVGALVFPLAYRLLPALADRGYSLSRALGLMLWGYLFWLLGSLGVLSNNFTGLIFTLLALAGLSAWAATGIRREALREWWRAQRGFVVAGEALFLLALAGWALVRSYMPEALGTEKPMELAFINAILRSPSFPPRDPWLAGYGISYYYFGYVIVAMLAKLTGTPGSVAFNLGVSMIFALSALGAYGLVYNLLGAYRRERGKQAPPRSLATFAALLGPLFVLIVSNLEGFLHALHNRGLFWRQDAAGNWVSPFWTWLDIKDLSAPPVEPFSWVPERFWWWWRASRVLQDYNLAGGPLEIIDEFPFFSYLLADLHPHVLAMPFGLLAVALALNLMLGGSGDGPLRWFHRRPAKRSLAWAASLSVLLGVALLLVGSQWVNIPMVALSVLLLSAGSAIVIALRKDLVAHGLLALLRGGQGSLEIGRTLRLQPADFLLGAVVLGGMFFMNAWDFPVYVALFAGAYALRQAFAPGKPLAQAIPDFLWLGFTLGASGVLLYLPFYLSFSSQAGGPLPNLIFPTRGAHLWVMFGPLLLPIFAFLAYLAARQRDRRALRRGLGLALGFAAGMLALALLMGAAIVMLPGLGDFYQGFLGSPDAAALFGASLARRLSSPGGWITLGALLALALGVLLGAQTGRPDEGQAEDEPPDSPGFPSAIPTAHLFSVLLILLGTLMVFGPEFFYLRDQFGWRMNTIFKFYYQAWLLWSLAAAYGSIVLLRALRGGWGVAFSLGLTVLLAASLVYPVFSLANKADGFQASERSLDSSAYLQRDDPDSWAAVRWLQSAPEGVIAEAVPATGGSYTHYGRMATLSGMPNLLGWVGHESQWRGGGGAMGNRQTDLARLYCTPDWSEARAILDNYDIRYVVVGPLEQTAYQPDPNYCPSGLALAKFMRYLTPVFQSGGVTIYEYRGEAHAAP